MRPEANKLPQFGRGAHVRPSASPLLVAMIRLATARGKRRKQRMKRCVATALAIVSCGTLGASAQDWPTQAGPHHRAVRRRRDARSRGAADRRSSAQTSSGSPSSSRTSRAPAAIPAPMRWPRPRPTARPSASASAARSPSTRCCSRNLPYDPQKGSCADHHAGDATERARRQCQPRRGQRAGS